MRHFFWNTFLPENLGNWAKNRVFWIQRKIWLILTEFALTLVCVGFIGVLYEVGKISPSGIRLWKSEIPSSEFCPISGDWGKSGIPKLALIPLNLALEIRNTPIWVLPNIWRLGQIRDTKVGTNTSNKMLMNTAKCQGYSIYIFWVVKAKPTGVGWEGGLKLTSPRLGLKRKFIFPMFQHKCYTWKKSCSWDTGFFIINIIINKTRLKLGKKCRKN